MATSAAADAAVARAGPGAVPPESRRLRHGIALLEAKRWPGASASGTSTAKAFMPNGERRLWCGRLLTAVFLGTVLSAAAVDNPDAPDHVADFAARDRQQEALVDNSPTQAAALLAYDGYHRFLQRELDAALAALRARLGTAQRLGLDAAQARWRAWHDSETRFIDNTWTRDTFGSAAGLSRAAYRCALLRDRTRLLLQYLKDQPTR